MVRWRDSGSQLCFFFPYFCVSYVISSRNHLYSHQELLDMGHTIRLSITEEFSHFCNIPNTIRTPRGAPWILVKPAGGEDGEDTRSKREPAALDH